MSIQAPQTGWEIDRDLRAICDILEAAKDENNEGKVVYIRHGEISLEDGEALFDITPLTQEE